MSSATTRGVRRHGDGPLVRALATLPAMTYLVVLMVVPLGLVIAYAFLTAGRFGGVQGPVTLDNVTRMLEPLYRAVLASSILNAGTATEHWELAPELMADLSEKEAELRIQKRERFECESECGVHTYI